MICIGYAGREAFDVILYIGRTLTKLNKRVLIIDLSDTGAMTSAICHGMDIDSSVDIVNYRDINYIRKIPSDNELKEFSDGVILISFGSNYSNLAGTPIKLDSINLVSDTLPSNIDKIKKIAKSIDNDFESIRLLIRDVVNVDADVKRVKTSLELSKDPVSVSHLYHNMDDYESAVNCQVSQVIRFIKISYDMEKYITSEIQSMFPDIKEKQIRKAINMARKGV